MGTIAEMLGIDLGGDEPLVSPAGSPPGPDEAATPGADADDAGAAPATGEAAQRPAAPVDPVGEAVMAAVLDETSLDPTQARAELPLTGPEMDLDRLGRYSVVAAVERELHIQFPDVEVEAWETLGDVLEAARTLAGSQR